MTDIIDLASVRKAKAKAVPKPRHQRKQVDPALHDGAHMAYQCWTIVQLHGAVDLDAAARAYARKYVADMNGEWADLVCSDPDRLLSDTDAAVSLLCRWRVALHAALIAAEADDPPDRVA